MCGIYLIVLEFPEGLVSDMEFPQGPVCGIRIIVLEFPQGPVCGIYN